MVKLFFARRSLNESEVLSTNTFNPLIVQQSAEKFEMNLGVWVELCCSIMWFENSFSARNSRWKWTVTILILSYGATKQNLTFP